MFLAVGVFQAGTPWDIPAEMAVIAIAIAAIAIPAIPAIAAVIAVIAVTAAVIAVIAADDLNLPFWLVGFVLAIEAAGIAAGMLASWWLALLAAAGIYGLYRLFSRQVVGAEIGA